MFLLQHEDFRNTTLRHMIFTLNWVALVLSPSCLHTRSHGGWKYLIFFLHCHHNLCIAFEFVAPSLEQFDWSWYTSHCHDMYCKLPLSPANSKQLTSDTIQEWIVFRATCIMKGSSQNCLYSCILSHFIVACTMHSHEKYTQLGCIILD